MAGCRDVSSKVKGRGSLSLGGGGEGRLHKVISLPPPLPPHAGLII